MLLRKILWGTLVCLVCLTLTLNAEAKKERGPGFREKEQAPFQQPGDETDRLIKWRELGLSQEQREQFKLLRREFQVATASLRKELAFAEEDLRTELRRDTLDREKIDRLVQDISDLKRRLSEAATENLLALKGILTPEQRERLAASQYKLPKELSQLQLTPDQKVQIGKLFKSSIRHNRKLSGELRDMRGELRDLLLSSDAPDEKQLQDIQTQIAEKELELERARVNDLLSIREVLNAEQLQLLK